MAGLFQAASKQRNPLGTTIRTHGSGKYTFGLALSAGQYPRSACLFLSAPRGMRHLPDQCHQLHHRLLRFQKLGCQRRLALDAEAGWWNRAVVCGCWGLTSMLRVIWWCAESRDLLTLGEGMKSL